MAAPRFVVCGDDPLAHRLVKELTSRYDAQVTVILPSRHRNHGPQLASLRRIKIVEAERLDERAFRAAELGKADGLALLRQDDAGNIHTALQAKELHPKLRLVIRMFNMSLGHGIRTLFRDCAVLSDASMAAPELVAVALGEIAPNFVRLPGRTLYVARRSDVRAKEVVCGIATTAPGQEPEVLPADERADLVLAVANRRDRPARSARSLERYLPDPGQPAAGNLAVSTPEAGGSGSGDSDHQLDAAPAVSRPRRHRRSARRRRRILAIPRALLSLVDSKLEIATVTLVAILVGGTVAIALIDQVTPWQALYTTLIIAADAGDPDLQVGLSRQLTQAAVAVAGIAMVPVLTATVVNAAVNARLAATVGRLRAPMSGHCLVIGLGNVGTRVIRMLHELGHEVVAVDRTESARGVRVAQELGIPLVIGDAAEEETLRQASVRGCQAVLALTSSDAVNLEAALLTRSLRPGLRVVLRLFDGDFARRVETAFDLPHSRSVSSLAAPAFAAALLEREVIGTIAVQRRVLLIAEVEVAAGSVLAGARLADVARTGELRVIALLARQEHRPRWTPPAHTRIDAGDRLIVAANQAGLSKVLSWTALPMA